VGFLKFLKRNRASNINTGQDDMDMPPLPPDADFDSDLGRLPSVPSDNQQFFDMDPGQDMPEFREPMPFPERMGMIKNSFPEMPKPEVRIKKPAPIPQALLNVPMDPPEQMERQFSQKLPHVEEERPQFVRIDKFKNYIEDIGAMRASVKNANISLDAMTSLENRKSVSFEKYKASMIDLQKKLAFAEKTIFKR